MPAAPATPVSTQARGWARRLGPWVQEVNAQTLRSDALAAVLAAVMAIPQGIAFAALAGVPPAWGLYASILPTAVAALMGSGRLMITGPTNALSLALSASLAPLAVVGSDEYLRLALVLTLLVGVIQVAVWALRLGAVTHFISPTVLLGFTSGAAVLIATHAAEAWWKESGDAVPTLMVGLVALVLALALKRFWPRGPGLLVALVGATLIAALGSLEWGWRLAHVAAPAQGWPQLALPEVQWQDLPKLSTIALALTLVALGQSIAISKALAARTGQVFDVNRECLGQGLANLAGAGSSALVSCGSLNRSAPHIEAGARTPLSAVMAAGLVLVLVGWAGSVLAWVPMAAIDAVLLLVAWSLVDAGQWRELWRVDRRELGVAAGTFAATLVLPLEVAVLAGVAASLVLYLQRTAHPALRSMGFAMPPKAGAERRFVVLEPGAPECPQLKLLRMEGPVWYGAEAHVAEALRQLREPSPAGEAPPAHLLVMCKSMNFVDSAGIALWERERVLRSGPGQGLYFHRPRPEVQAAWERSGFLQRLGPGRIFPDKRSAIAAIVPRLDPAVCARCKARVFEECSAQPAP
jgi:sulfate permease, SulP family